MLISPEYRQEMERLNGAGSFGSAGRTFGIIVSSIIQKAGITHLLDYGCGSKMMLRNAIKDPPPGFVYQGYDPGVPKLSGDPAPAEMVVACDCLEHVEPDCLDDVLDHLEDLTEAILFASIATGPAAKKLSDCRNAHLITQPMQWWLPKFWERFELQTAQISQPGQFFIVANRQGLNVEDGYFEATT